MNGMFISFEGIDFCGKTTQVQLLKSKLESLGKTVRIFREPGGNEISEEIRDVLLKNRSNAKMSAVTELLLYSASRRQLVEQNILPSLKRGEIVICDRYVDSTRAYQQNAREIPAGFVDSVSEVATDGLMPQLTFVLDISVAESHKRAGNTKLDRLENEGDLFKEKVREGFLKLGKSEPNRVKILDGTQSIKAIFNEIWKETERDLQ